jgi:hypothetical protein
MPLCVWDTKEATAASSSNNNISLELSLDLVADHVHLDVLWGLVAGSEARDQRNGNRVDRSQNGTKKCKPTQSAGIRGLGGEI